MAINRVIHLSKMTGTAGSEGHLLVLLPALRALGVDARLQILVEPHRPVQDYADRAAALGVPVERTIIRRHFDPDLWQRLAAGFRVQRPDIVHTHLFHADLYGIPAARRAGVHYVVSSRHNDDKFRRWLPIRLLHQQLWRHTDAGIAISEAIRQFIVKYESPPAGKIHTIHYGLDPATVHAPPDARQTLRTALNLPAGTLLVGSVCRLIEQKGLRYGIQGFAQIANRIPDAHYVIAGDGPLRSELEADARALSVANRVHFLGWRDDARTILAALDVLLAPSLWEGFGLVFLEAMALGVPVISTRVSAIPEVVADRETGWLVPPHDSDAVAAALLDVLSDADRRCARGAQGRQRLEDHFTVEKMAERTLAVYHNLEANG